MEHSAMTMEEEDGGLLTTEKLELEALYKIARLTGSALELDRVLAETLQVLHQSLKMERATLVLLDEEADVLKIRASYGLTAAEAGRGVYRAGEGIIGRIFVSASPCVVPDVSKEPLFLNRTRSRPQLEKQEITFIGVPVLLLERPVGVLTADRLFGPEVSFEEDVRFLTVVATMVAQFLNLHEAISARQRVLVEENQLLRAELGQRYNRHNIIGQSKLMQLVFQAIDKVAVSTATVLLLGESGTGKELVARAIHHASPRKERPFVKVNCAALPENLLESELFGHERGAFTGASVARPGRFELADSGTLFLDEIGELPLVLQAKLLRVLQEKQFERLGGSRTLTVDVRIIAATNRRLEDAVAEGDFRADLYYRLNVVPILLPPLRERREDIGLLLDSFLAATNRENKRRVRLDRPLLRFLAEYDWPGNVRELQNLVERLVIMADGDTVGLADLPSSIGAEGPGRFKPAAAPERRPAPVSPPAAAATLEDMEKTAIETALLRHAGIQARAARDLGLTQRQIGYRIKKYNILLPYGSF